MVILHASRHVCLAMLVSSFSHVCISCESINCGKCGTVI